MMKADTPQNTRGAVVTLSNRAREPQHEASVHAELARRIAELQGMAFLGEYDPAMDYSGKLYFVRSEEHTSELQSRENLVCRLLLEKKTPDLKYPPCGSNTAFSSSTRKVTSPPLRNTAEITRVSATTHWKRSIILELMNISKVRRVSWSVPPFSTTSLMVMYNAWSDKGVLIL